MNRLDMEDVAEICKASGPAGGPARPRSRSPRRGNGVRRLSIAARWGTMPPLFYVGRLRRVRRRADCGDGGRMKGPDEHTPRACKRQPRPLQGRRAARQFGSPGACGSQWRTSLGRCGAISWSAIRAIRGGSIAIGSEVGIAAEPVRALNAGGRRARYAAEWRRRPALRYLGGDMSAQRDVRSASAGSAPPAGAPTRWHSSDSPPSASGARSVSRSIR